MSNKLVHFFARAILVITCVVLSSAALALGQTPVTITQTPATVTKTVQNPDGTYTVIEYPLKKEIKVTLNPISLTNSKGIATILRDDDGTRVVLNLSDLPADVTAVNLYAVDDAGAITSLGPVAITNGTGTFNATTPLTKFMLIAAPDTALTAYDPNTKVFFRSAVPEGFAVIPHTTQPVGETVAASTAAVAAPETPYTVPMLNIPAYKTGDDTKIKVNFSGVLSGARANVFVTPNKGGATKVKLRFHDLKEAPAGKVFNVWAMGADSTFVKIGQVVSTGKNNEGQIESEVSFADFGLLITMEDIGATGASPIGPAIGIVEIVR
jgi:hypothetical protein